MLFAVSQRQPAMKPMAPYKSDYLDVIVLFMNGDIQIQMSEYR